MRHRLLSFIVAVIFIAKCCTKIVWKKNKISGGLVTYGVDIGPKDFGPFFRFSETCEHIIRNSVLIYHS